MSDPRVKWIFETSSSAVAGAKGESAKKGSIQTSCCTSEDGVVFFGCEDMYVYGVDTRDGSRKWRYLTNGPISSSPVVCETSDNVYVGSWDGYLYALTKVSGSVRWKFLTGSQIWSTPAVSPDGKYVYVGSNDCYMYCIDAAKGSLKWKFKSGGQIYSSPIVSQTKLFFGCCDKNFYALDLSSGKERWRFETGGEICGSPSIRHLGGSQGAVYFGSGDGGFYALYYDGRQRWKLELGSPVNGRPCMGSNGDMYIGTQGGFIYGIRIRNLLSTDPSSPPTPEIKWKYRTGKPVESSLCISEVYSCVYCGCNDKFLYALSTEDGTLTWKTPTIEEVGGGACLSPDGSGVIVGSGDILYCLRNELKVKKKSPKKKKSPDK